LNQIEYQTVININSSKRYEYFIKKIVDYEEVWSLYFEGWAMVEDHDNARAIPFWPKEEFAKYCAEDEWANYVPRNISLHDFINDWLPGMEEDGYKASIFFNGIDACVLEINTLKKDIETELKNY